MSTDMFPTGKQRSLNSDAILLKGMSIVRPISTDDLENGHFGKEDTMKKMIYAACVMVFLSTGMVAWAGDSASHVSKSCAIELKPLVLTINQFVARRELSMTRINELEKMVKILEEKLEAQTQKKEDLIGTVTQLEIHLEKALSEMVACETTLQPIAAKTTVLKSAYQELATRFARLELEEQSLHNLIGDAETRYTGYQTFFDHVTVDLDRLEGLSGPHLIFTGANVHIQSGWGYTEDGNTGLGNLIIGHNDDHPGETPLVRTGAHNLVIGSAHAYSSYGGFISGHGNTVNGPYTSVSGGTENTANGPVSSVSAGKRNTASGLAASVSGGLETHAEGDYSHGP